MNAIIRYHEETKHHFHRHARSAGAMDWANQPNPFRFYEGKAPISLPFLKQEPTAGHHDLYVRENNAFQPINSETVGGFLELSLALSAWKAIPGSQWSLRINPSSGNLHPTEAHLLLPASENSEAGAYHYNPFLHALEQRAVIPKNLWLSIRDHFGTDGFLIGLSSIYWRESWKYGERAFRYCHLDAGHALACLCFSANLFGWRVICLNALSDNAIGTMLGFDRTTWRETETEHPDMLCFVCDAKREGLPRSLPAQIISEFATLSFGGTPNVLSQKHVNWDVIYEAAAVSEKPDTPEKRFDYGRRFSKTVGSSFSAARIIRQRRSGTAYHPEGQISKDRFVSVLDKTLPGNGFAPFDAEIGESCVNLLIFVHNVEGLESGMYFLVRDGHPDAAEAASHPLFVWKSAVENFPLYLLQSGDCRDTATRVSCHQDIAGDGAFSVGMIARFREIVEESPWKYRRLLWECGMIGQVLYLEAEACGMRGTGIGCYFDDAVHELMGFSDNTYQSLYHFAVGKPIEDGRLFGYPPYHHLKKLS